MESYNKTYLGPVKPPYQRLLNIGPRVGEHIAHGVGLLEEEPSVIQEESAVPEPPFYDAAKWIGRKASGLASIGFSPISGAIEALVEEPISDQLQLDADIPKDTADLLSIAPTLFLPGSVSKATKLTRKSNKKNKYSDIDSARWGNLDAVTTTGRPMSWGYTNVPEGTRAAVRLNLEATDQSGKGQRLQAIHIWDESTQGVNRIGQHIGHSNAVPLTDIEFMVHQPTRIAIAQGKSKSKAAAVVGNVSHMSPASMTRIKNSADVEVSMNPHAGNMFIDRTNGMPVKSADFAIAEGNTVYLKGNVEYYTPDELTGGRFFPENTLDQRYYNPPGVLTYQRGDRPLFPQYESELFDLRQPFRDYPQFAIPHDIHKKPELIKKYEKKWEFVSRPENVARIREAFDRGAQAGGLSWYNTEPLRLRFIEEFGSELGNNQFAKFMGLVAAASSQTPINRDIHIAMEVFSRMAKARKSGESVSFAGIPGIMQGTHTNTMQDVMGATDLSPGSMYFGGYGTRPKTTRFNENLLGNLYPLTVDTHNLKLLLGEKGLPVKGFDPQQYRYAEIPQQEMAADLGVPPAMYQSATWVGGETGVTDVRPFLELLEERIKFNAGATGMKPDMWFKKWMRGEIPAIYSIGPIAMTGSGALIANEIFKEPKDKDET